MWRSPLLVAILLAATFACGLLAGLDLKDGSALSATTASRAEPSTDIAGGSTAVQEDVENAKLKIQVRDLGRDLDQEKRRQTAAILADRIAFFKKYSTIGFTVESLEGFHVSPVMADFLGMSDGEKKTVNAELDQAHSQMKAWVASNIKLIKQDANSVSYQIPVNPQGKEVRQELSDEVTSGLGEDRAKIFMASGGWQWSESMYGFGDQATQIEITRTSTSGPAQYLFKESTGNGSMTQTMSGGQVPAKYQGLLQVEP